MACFSIIAWSSMVFDLYINLDIILCLPHAERNENICFLAVLLELWSILVLLLQEGDSGYESDQQSNKNSGVKGNPAILDRASEDGDSPPREGLSEVVRVSAVSPKSTLNNLASIFFVISELL